MARYLIITSDNEDQKMRDVLAQLEAEEGGRSGMRSGSHGYRRDSRGYPMDVTNLRSGSAMGSRGYRENEKEIEALEEQIQELKMRKKQLEHGEEGMRYDGGAYGPYPKMY